VSHYRLNKQDENKEIEMKRLKSHQMLSNKEYKHCLDLFLDAIQNVPTNSISVRE